jgi:acyl-CoA reductase-like NAD-dependent aldehyde dehydrogenase
VWPPLDALTGWCLQMEMLIGGAWTPPWRADLMPYGGLKASGISKEGPRSAMAEMTNTKTVILHGRHW